MANWSNSRIALVGNPEVLKEVEKEIRANSEENYLCPIEFMGLENPTVEQKTNYGGGEINNIEIYSNIMDINMSGRWASPSGFFKDLAKKYNLGLEYLDYENGCNFCHWIEMENGELVEEKQDNLFSEFGVEKVGLESLVCDYFSYIDSEEAWEENKESLREVFSKTGVNLEKVHEILQDEVYPEED